MITKCLDNRPYSRCPPSLPPIGIDGIKAMSRGISGTVIKLANASNRGRVYLFSQNEKTFILVLQNVVLPYYGLLSEHLRCRCYIQKGNNEHFHPKFFVFFFQEKTNSSAISCIDHYRKYHNIPQCFLLLSPQNFA